MPMGKMFMITDYLAEGAENARTARELCRILGINNRQLTRAIERARRAGAPICAGSGSISGYYLAADQTEMENYCNNLAHRLRAIHATRWACMATINRLPLRASMETTSRQG